MSNVAFTIDAIPTPKIDLATAFEADLQYWKANGKLPPLGRSALKNAEEKLNNYLKYVNENFIQEGFSSSSSTIITATDTKMSMYANNGAMTLTTTQVNGAQITLNPAYKANLHFDWWLGGTFTAADSDTPTGVLTAELWLDAVKKKEWKWTLDAGFHTLGTTTCYANETKGSHILQLKLALSSGSLAVASSDHYAFGYGQIVR